MRATGSTPAHETLMLLAPPLKLIVWLERMFELKRRSGEAIPQQFEDWMERWALIRSNLPSPAWDHLTAEDMTELSGIVDRALQER